MYDERLAERVRSLLTAAAPEERKMFGGLAFMVGGYMTVGISGGDLMVRTGPDRFAEALDRPGARPMDFTGRAMKGFVFVGEPGQSDADLAYWVEMATSFAATLPPKAPGAPSKAGRGARAKR